MQHIPDLYADIDLQMLKRKVQALESAITNPKREWVGLTDEEIVGLYRQIADCTEWAIGGLTHALPFAHAIEAKLKEKNT